MTNALPILTSAEKKWLCKLEKVLQECPSDRLACYTTGDNDLTFYDKIIADKWAETHDDSCDARELHEKDGSYLTTVTGSFNIDSCAG